MNYIEFTIETPPISLNQTIAHQGGKLRKTKKGRVFMNAVKTEIMCQRGKLPEMCFYDIEIKYPGIYRNDINNMDKPILDCFVQMQRIPDDSYAMKNTNEYLDIKHIEVIFTERDFEECLQIRQYSPATVRKYRKLLTT